MKAEDTRHVFCDQTDSPLKTSNGDKAASGIANVKAVDTGDLNWCAQPAFVSKAGCEMLNQEQREYFGPVCLCLETCSEAESIRPSLCLPCVYPNRMCPTRMPIDSTPLSTTFSVCVRERLCVCVCVIGRGHVRGVISIYSVRLPDHSPLSPFPCHNSR